MFDFKYIHFGSLAETLDYLKTAEDYCLMAGGTDVIVQYRAGKLTRRNVVDVLLPELTGISETDGEYRIGASTALTEVSDFFVKCAQPYYVLHTAAESVGSCQTRNLGTIGGNICTGNASSDMATALLVVNAQAVISGADGERTLPMDRFFIKNRVVALEKGELLKEIVIPKTDFAQSGAAFTKIGKRRGHVIATLNVAAAIGRDEDGVIRDAKLAFGTMAPRPVRLYESERELIGCKAGSYELRAAVERIGIVVLSEIQPRDSKRGSKEYRVSAGISVLSDAIFAACGMEA